MTFLSIMGAIIIVAGTISALFFKKGGIYNPTEQKLELPVLPLDAPPAPKYSPTEDMLSVFCLAIRDFEGKPGDANYKNNNPGNCRYSTIGYLPKYGNVRCSPAGFAIFPTYELGWEYLLNLVHFMAIQHPNWTILDFFNTYAPESDNNPTKRYASFVAKRCGVAVDYHLRDLFT